MTAFNITSVIATRIPISSNKRGTLNLRTPNSFPRLVFASPSDPKEVGKLISQ